MLALFELVKFSLLIILPIKKNRMIRETDKYLPAKIIVTVLCIDTTGTQWSVYQLSKLQNTVSAGKIVHSNIMVCYAVFQYYNMLCKNYLLKKECLQKHRKSTLKDQQQNVKGDCFQMKRLCECSIFLYIPWSAFRYILNKHILFLQLDFQKQCYLNKLHQL